MSYFIDPPVSVFCIYIVIILVFLRIVLRRDRFYVFLVSALLCFLFAEGACRWLNIGKQGEAVWEEQIEEDAEKFLNSFFYKSTEREQQLAARNFFSHDRYVFTPNTNLIYRYSDNPRGYFDTKNQVIGTINAKGFRGQDRDFQKPAGIKRIAFLGDSFTLGIGVKDNDTLPSIFERAIQLKYPQTEVLNFGVSGTNTYHQIILLEEYILRFEPDIVTIILFLNDTDRIGTNVYLIWQNVLKKVGRRSYFINAFVRTIEKIVQHENMILHYQEGYIDGNEGWEKVKSALRKGKTLSKKHNFQLVVAVYPVIYQLDDQYPFRTIHQTIGDYCGSLNIPFIDLFTGLKGNKDSALWVHPSDPHPNEVANKIAGAELAVFFDRKKLLK